jgi:hypothetical protein
VAEWVFGKPASIGSIPGWEILVYHKNLLTQVKAAPLPRVE